MGIFSNISDFFKSSNSLAKTSHQKHMENVENSGIKVLEIQRKGTESTVVEVPKDLANYTSYIVPTIISNYPKKFKTLKGASNQDVLVFDSVIRDLAKITEKALTWGFRDSKFYEELQGYDLTGTWVSTTISEDKLEIEVHFRELCISSTITSEGIKRNTDLLNDCYLPYEDRQDYNNLRSSHYKQLKGTCVTVIWKERYLEIGIDVESVNYLQGKYYIYHPKLGLLIKVRNEYMFSNKVGRNDWAAIIMQGVHLSSQEEANKLIESYVKPYLSSLKSATGYSANASDLLVLSSGRAFIEYNKLRFG